MPPRQDRPGGVSSLGSSSSAQPPSGRPVHYTELHGAAGRDVYFRPERYPRSELGAVGVLVEVTRDGVTERCELADISQNGFAFEWPTEAAPEIGATREEVRLSFDEHEAYRGRARVSSLRRHERALLVGVSLIDTLMNIEDVLALRDVKARMAAPEFDALSLAAAPWRVPGQERFKALVAELHVFLEDAQRNFAKLEATLPWHVVHGDQDSPARDALVARVRQGFAADVVQASNEIDAALRGASPEARERLSEYSGRLLDGLLMLSPWMYRARHKPLGYPGDFELMNGLYGRHFSGATLFAKALNLAFVSTPAAEAVRRRKDMIKGRLAAALDAHSARSEPLRILSIAAGPAEEVYGLLEERTEIDVPLEVVLFDQDKSALSYSYGRLSRLVAARWQGKVRIIHLHDSITHLLRGSTALTGTGQYHAVYACGLFDYLQPHTWVSLCRTLSGAVAPGGTLYVGNMVPSSPSRWFMELHLDWYLEYRERTEILELARKAVPNAEHQILDEPTGVNPFVAITRV
jgi:extracellular factor (EF) 3-hydroxypalmitic acid methyl ester biosynthesis protein